MKESISYKAYLKPFLVYVFVIISILLMRIYVPWPYAVSASAVLMLLMPHIMKSETAGDFGWDSRGVILGIIVTALLLAAYLLVLAGYGLYTSQSLTFQHLSVSFILMQLLLVAVPEEVFFRGYLQRVTGNDLKAVVIVSVLFALGHFVTLCLGGKHDISACTKSVLTFFPSLVMGYLYMKTGSLWASIIFHFIANLVHVSAGLS